MPEPEDTKPEATATHDIGPLKERTRRHQSLTIQRRVDAPANAPAGSRETWTRAFDVEFDTTAEAMRYVRENGEARKAYQVVDVKWSGTVAVEKTEVRKLA